MIREIQNRIDELNVWVNKRRDVIIGINHAVEEEGFKPSNDQQKIIEYTCKMGRWGLEEIKRLERLKIMFVEKQGKINL